MKFGVHLPHIGPAADPAAIRDFAQMAEGAGFDSVWVSDHIVVPRDIDSRYPYSPTGDFVAPPDWPWVDALSTLAFVAGVTERVELGTTVLIVPMRNPVATAKALAAIEHLSRGRLIVGVGAGWMAEEFAALDAPFEHRGARLDEYVALMRGLWTSDDPTFEGRFYRLGNVGFAPKPLRPPPIWVGGHTDAALRRTARIGDGWHPAFLTAAEIAALLPKLRACVAEAGRADDPPRLTARIDLTRDALDPGAAIATIREFAELGIEHLLVQWPGALNPGAAEADLNRFQAEIAPAFAEPSGR